MLTAAGGDTKVSRVMSPADGTHWGKRQRAWPAAFRVL